MLIYKDFQPGQQLPLGPRLVTAEEIITFAERYDPQPFHLDGNSEQAEQVSGLIASGWHTCAMLMRMMCDAYLLDTASQGSGGLDEVRWLHPVRPGDTLSGSAEVLEKRVSKSNPNLGIIKFKYALQNQDKQTVITMTGMGMVDVMLPVEAAR